MDERQFESLMAELARIRRNTSFSWGRAIGYSLLKGAMFVIGSLLAIALAGWVLSLLGVIPGIGDVANHLYHLLQVNWK